MRDLGPQERGELEVAALGADACPLAALEQGGVVHEQADTGTDVQVHAPVPAVRGTGLGKVPTSDVHDHGVTMMARHAGPVKPSSVSQRMLDRRMT